jgi:hypothetical protein
VTSVGILLKTCFNTPLAGSEPPGYVEPLTGCVSPLQVVAFESFQSSPLHHHKGELILLPPFFLFSFFFLSFLSFFFIYLFIFFKGKKM